MASLISKKNMATRYLNLKKKDGNLIREKNFGIKENTLKKIICRNLIRSNVVLRKKTTMFMT